MYTCKELKVLSKGQLKGNWIKIILALIIAAAITGGASMIIQKNYNPYNVDGRFLLRRIFEIIIEGILSAIISFGIVKIVLDISNGAKTKVLDIFYGFKNFARAFKIYFRMFIFIAPWFLPIIVILLIVTFYIYMILFMMSMMHGEIFTRTELIYFSVAGLITLALGVIGTIKYLSYYFSVFIVMEDKNISAKDAMALSKKLSDGNKLKMTIYSIYASIPLIIVGILFFIFSYYYKKSYSDTTLVMYAIFLGIFIITAFYVDPMIRLGLANIY
ncbi:MAG: DUF975 family protein, partial [Fusobacteriaceae bacterium]